MTTSPQPTGFLLIDKPAGITSHDVVDRVRRITNERCVGHAGTLDPFATGLLIVGVGRAATKHLNHFLGMDKTYEAIFTFGAESDTDDKTGTITKSELQTEISRQQIESILPTLTGPLQQTPPTYAAIKIKGKKLYESAREGNPIIAPPRSVTVHEFVCLGGDQNRFSFRISCSSGTYIRSLARDLGRMLGVGAYVEELRRTKIGEFDVSLSIPLEKLAQPVKLLPLLTFP